MLRLIDRQNKSEENGYPQRPSLYPFRLAA